MTKNILKAKLNNIRYKNVTDSGKLAFNLFKLDVLSNMDYSGSKDELDALKWAVIKFRHRDEDLKTEEVDNIIFSGFKKLYLSQNKKTGYNTLNFNVSPALTCKEAFDGHCTLQKPTRDSDFSKTGAKTVCYALAQEMSYKLKMVYGVLNYIVMHEIDDAEAIRQVRESLVRLNTKYLRFNEFGSFYNENILVRAINIARGCSDLAIAYSYTSNTKLFKKYYNNKWLTLNLSNKVIKGLTNYKRTITVKPSKENFLKYMKSPNHVVCNGDCSNCSYCKNWNDYRVVVFFEHGHGIKLGIWDSKHPNDPECCLLTKEQYNKFMDGVRKENNTFLDSIGGLHPFDDLIEDLEEDWNL